jgi:hypothetical protein
VFWRAGWRPGGTETARLAAVNSGKFSDRNRVNQESAVPKLLSTSQIWAGFAAGRSALGDSTALFVPMLEKSPNSGIGKSQGIQPISRSYDRCAAIGRGGQRNYCVEVVHD